MRRLDYLHGLGVTCIWLLPFQTSPGRDDGYDISDYYSVDPRYGTLGDFVEFTHRPSSAASASSSTWWSTTPPTSIPGSRRRARDPQLEVPRLVRLVGQEAGPRPTRAWCSPACRRSTWTYDKEAKAWYFHRFYEFQPDLNIANPQVQAEILKIMGFWIQLGVSGFRMDAVPFMIETKGAERQEAGRAIRHAARVPRVPAVAAAATAIMLAEANVLAGDGHGVLRRRRRPHAHDVQLPGQPAPVLRAGAGRRAPAGQGAGGDEAAPGDGAMGPLPAQPRRARPRAADRGAAPDGLRRASAPTRTCSSTTAASAGGSRRCWTATGGGSSSPTA